MILISQAELWSLLWRSAVYGLLFGLLYDLLHAVCVASRVPDGEDRGAKIKLWRAGEILLASVLDFAFCITVAIVSILLMYRIGGGIFRGMVYLGIAAGFLFFRLTVSKILRKPSAILSKILRFIIEKLLFLIFLPLRGIISLIILIYRLTIGKIHDKIKEEKIRREEERKSRMIAAPDVPEGEEADVYAEKKTQYKRDGRINFAKKNGQHL